MNKQFICFFYLFFNILPTISSQEQLTYQKPPKEILELADYETPPSILIDDNIENILFMYHATYKSLSDLYEKELKLAGLIINPKTNALSRSNYVYNIKYKINSKSDIIQVEGLPDNPKLSEFSWSPNQTKIAFTNTTDKGVELWCFDFLTGNATRLTTDNLNANFGESYNWFRDSSGLLVKMIPSNSPALIETNEIIPIGPIISTNEKGRKSQNRTYQNLLRNKIDEDNFEKIMTSELYKVSLSGDLLKWKQEGTYLKVAFSPNGKYLLITRLQKPYSYFVGYRKFPTNITVYDLNGYIVKEIEETPLIEFLPKGFMAIQKGKRNISWRNDKASTLYWVEALDEGDPEKEVPYRDEIFEWEAPFEAQPNSLAKTINRFVNVLWGDNDIAILNDTWWNTRNTKTYVFNPSNFQEKPTLLFDRNYQDSYNDPGDFDMIRNQYGRYVLNLNGKNAYLIGEGYKPEGQFPFVDEINLKSKRKKRLFQSSNNDHKLEIVSINNKKSGEYFVSIESPTKYPNYYIIDTKKKKDTIAITNFNNPFESLLKVHKEIVKYKRHDGVELTSVLYLPAEYNMQKKEKIPMIIWAYPVEYKDKYDASQITVNKNEFIYPNYKSPIYWATKGYAILDKAAFPIVGEGKTEPNDTFIEQLVANAKAAIDAVDSLGYIDRNRVAIGGHSYGAFMASSLLTHSDLFCCGIALSGAYNRTLTPFGFQSEVRNYWEVPNVYNKISPFMHSNIMKYPLLLIHGENDENSGTLTMQSERYFNALKGLGKLSRLVILPKEGHNYIARESILHLLWEQDKWLDKYVKNRFLLEDDSQ